MPMPSSPSPRSTTGLRLALLAGLGISAVASSALAHVTVAPRQSVAGQRETYVIRVPNERQADTVRIEGDFPPGLKVSAFEANPSWMIAPKRDASGAIVGASWTGDLPPDQFTEFRLIAQNPRAAASLAWRFTQTYADGTKVEWAGPKGSKTPAPQTELGPAPP